MHKLEHSGKLGRKIREDDLPELGISTWSLIEEAILEGDKEQALELLDYLYTEGKMHHDQEFDTRAALITYMGSNFGEEQVEKYWRTQMAHHVYGEIAQTRLQSARERVYVQAETMKAHYQTDDELRVIEEEDRYVLLNDPCGSGGRMRRQGKEKSPYNFGVTSKPYPWSWSKTGVLWYCVHCALVRGTMAVEACGYPVRVHEYPDDPQEPCRIYYYKKPELIPEKYFTELGVKKDPSRFTVMK